MTDRDLIEAALRYFVWAAGEGHSPPGSEAPEPETTLFEFAAATGEDDYDPEDSAFIDRIMSRLPLSCSFARIVESSDGQPVLLYLEPDGETFILHQVVHLNELMMDVRIEGLPDEVDLLDVQQEGMDELVRTARRFVG